MMVILTVFTLTRQFR